LQWIEVHIWTDGCGEWWLVKRIGSVSIGGLLFDRAAIALALRLSVRLTLLRL
jgi:hypothetical protein